MTKTVMIDAGHGGKDPGACGNGLQEKDIALKVATEIATRLQSGYENVKCILTRSTDVFLELRDRTNKANSLKADALVSIHCNAGGGAGGFESFEYTKPSAGTTALQVALHSEIMHRLKPYGVIDRGQKAADLHMCRESKMPAVLTENLFIDVLADAAKLKRDEVLDAIIDGHVAGVAKYLGLKEKKQEDKPISVKVNGELVPGVILVNGTTYAPVRTIAEALGAKVDWDGDNKTANIKL